MKVTVAVHGRYHAFELAKGLHEAGYLRRLITTYPRGFTRSVVGAGAEIKTAVHLELWRRVYQCLPINGSNLEAGLAEAFGGLAAKNVPADSEILVGWSGATLETVAPARANGCKVVIERGSTHIEHQTGVLADAYARHGLTFDGTPARIIERELAEYEAADAISVPSTYAARTFVQRGFAAEKILVNPYGVDLEQFRSGDESAETRSLRILFVGQVGIRKGVPELIEAFKPLAGRAELHLVGPVEAAVRPLLTLGPSEGVFVRGPLSRDDLATEYRAADIFCLPSWEEGMAMVTLQAMAAGMPVVVTAATGAENVVSNGTDGIVLKETDIQTLTDVLSELIDDPAKRDSLGAAAQSTVAEGWTWQDYTERAAKMYEAILEAPS